MALRQPNEITRLLGEIAAGNEGAKNELFECVYDELRAMANRHMKHERDGHTLGTTGLVHEVYLRLQGPALNKNRAYFFGAAAQEGNGYSRPNVFFDCDGRNCNDQYYRTEIDWVNWVRDQEVADVHVIMTSLTTGAGGREYRLDFLDQLVE